jgi:MSHA biogenesis protein MshJ
MKQWWLIQSARIDAMSLRERAFLFLSLILVALALADVLWLSPAQTAHRQITQRYAAQGVELNRLRAELAQVAQPVDANRAAREELAAADAQLQQIMQEIKTLAPVLEGGPPLEQVLVQFLRRQPGLTLLGTTTLSVEAGASSGAAGSTPVPGLSKRGLELRVSGSYAELNRYVKTLEMALPNLRWGALALKKTPQGADLSLQVFVVGVQP